MPLGLKAATSDAAIHQKISGSGMATFIIWNEEMNDIIKIVQSLEESCLLTKGVSEKLKMKQKSKKADFSVRT